MQQKVASNQRPKNTLMIFPVIAVQTGIFCILRYASISYESSFSNLSRSNNKNHFILQVGRHQFV